MELSVIILAAGKGTRMKSDLPKVLHPIAHKPLLGHVLDTTVGLNAKQTCVVIGHGANTVKETFAARTVTWVEQKEQKGTGHAVQQALPHIKPTETVLILYGDVPLCASSTLTSLISCVSEQSIGLLTVTLENPTGYGRIIRDHENQVTGIVEEKDATPGQKQITEVNTGILAISGSHLINLLSDIDNQNAQGEYYLTDIFSLAHQQGIQIQTCQPENSWEVSGVNNRLQLAELERIYQLEKAKELMTDGVTLRDPSRIDIRGNVQTGHDVEIDVNVILSGDVILQDNVKIGANCSIKNATICSGSMIKDHSVIEDAIIGKNCTVGPFARLRPGTELLDDAHIGNFVEVKKSVIGNGSKVNHLTYIGDAEIGTGVNVGAGTITCNYDGANKHRTVIKDHAFIGSNTSLVAPVTIGKHATVGAGSTIGRDVDNNTLALTRAPQKAINNWTRPTKKPKGETT